MKKLFLYLMASLFSSMFIQAFASETNLLDMSKLPQPDGGIKVVANSEFDMSPDEFKKEANRLQQMKSKGYLEVDEPYAQTLMAYKYKGKIQIEENKNNHDPYDTHLKSAASDIKIAFHYNDIPLQQNSKIIGYAAGGGWVNGWTGIAVFFEDANLGVCVYTLDNRALTHGSAFISENSARYDINKMPNILDVRGNSKTGFIYDIIWYDNIYSKELKCADKIYDSKITNELIAQAYKIDKSS